MDKEIGKIDIHRSSPDKGFTLVELLIVFVILAIIAAIVVPVTFSIIDSSHDSDSKTMAKNIMNAVQTEFNQLAAEGELWYSISGKMGIILNRNRKRTGNGLYQDSSEFSKGFFDISNTDPGDNIFNKIEGGENIEILYVGAGNTYRYEFLTEEGDSEFDKKKMYKVYVILFKIKDDENIYFYDGKEVSTKWPFSSPECKADKIVDKTGQSFYLKNNDTQLQMYSLRPLNNTNCGEYFKSTIIPKVIKAQ